ncbi:hypothetical protein D9M68_561320 [compost metagenome]
MLDALMDFLINHLCYGLGRRILRGLSRGRLPGRSSYWFGLCLATGAATLIAAIALGIYLISNLR